MIQPSAVVRERLGLLGRAAKLPSGASPDAGWLLAPLAILELPLASVLLETRDVRALGQAGWRGFVAHGEEIVAAVDVYGTDDTPFDDYAIHYGPQVLGWYTAVRQRALFVRAGMAYFVRQPELGFETLAVPGFDGLLGTFGFSAPAQADLIKLRSRAEDLLKLQTP